LPEAAGSAGAPVVVGLPESLGRRMRLGPFPSSRHALKFAAYAAVGGTVAAVLGVLWTVPFVGAGFLLSVYRTDGRGLDEQFGEYVSFRWRGRGGPTPSRDRPSDRHPSGPYLTSVPGHLVAIVAVPGLPIAFLPPTDARALFEAYRDLLRELDHGFVSVMGVEPISERPFQPSRRGPENGGTTVTARQGYTEMVALLCRRRYRRRILVALWEPAGAEATVRLERAVEQLDRGLGRLGLSGVRLRDGTLRAAAGAIGWSGAPAR